MQRLIDDKCFWV